MILTVLLSVLGLALVVLVAYDAILATVAPSVGSGPLMRGLLRAVSALPAGPLRRLLPPGGGVLPGTVLLWAGLMWVGWTLVLGAGRGWVVNSTSGVPAGLVDRLYYAGYTVLTLGIGDYTPNGAWPQVATILACFNGLFLLTLTVTYQMNAVSAVVAQRGLAARVRALGATGADVVGRATGVDGGPELLAGQLATLADEVTSATQMHIAYPVLQRFDVTTPDRSATVAIAILVDTLAELAHARGGRRTAGEQLLAGAISTYVVTLTGDPGAHSRPGDGDDDDLRADLTGLLREADQSWPTAGSPV